MNTGINGFAETGRNPNATFVLHPRNLAFVRGERTQPEFPPTDIELQRGYPAAVFFVIVAIALGTFVYPSIIVRFGAVTNGQVIHTYTTDPSRNVTIFWVQFSYTVGGSTFTLREPTDSTMFEQAYNGQKNVKVKYLPQLPGVATIVDPSLSAPINATLLVIVGATIGIIFCLLVSIVIFNDAAQQRRLQNRRRAAWPTAALVTGQIISSSGAAHFSRASSWYTVTVIYNYRLPETDELVEGSDSAYRRDLRGNLPQSGTPVTLVVYPKPHRFRRRASYEFIL